MTRTRHNSPRRRLTGGAIVLGMLFPSIAEAHLVTTGLGPVYDGIGHFVLTLEDILPVVALGLLAGLRGTQAGRSALWTLPVAWLIGGGVGAFASSAPEFTFAAASFLALGVLVAIDVKVSASWVGVLAVALGLVHGFFNGVALRPGGGVGLGLLGIAATIFVVIALTSAGVLALRPLWTRIAVRVAGSWIAAVGLLVLGWALRKTE